MRMHRVVAGLVCCAGLVGLVGWSAAQDTGGRAAPKGDPAHKQHFWDCAKACDDCGRMCDACGAHCAEMVAQGHKDHMETLRTCQDCATVCKAAGSVTARTGPFSDAICTACAETCKRCGDACAKHAEHDQIMKSCAEECKRCEQACREMLKHTGHGAGGGSK